MFEAGLDPDILSGNHKLVVEGLVMWNIIDKRRLELNDMIKGKLFYYTDNKVV